MGPHAAVHLAVLANDSDELSAVLAYDGRHRRYLCPVGQDVSPARLSGWIVDRRPCQLSLFDHEGPAATSSGRTWRTWVLPSIPPSLRTLPPERLAVAFARLLTGEVPA